MKNYIEKFMQVKGKIMCAYGSYLFNKEKYRKALKILTKINNDENMYLVQNMDLLMLNKYKYSICLMRLGKYDDAIDELVTLHNLIPENMTKEQNNFLENIAFCYLMQGKLSKALLIYKHIDSTNIYYQTFNDKITAIENTLGILDRHSRIKVK